MSSMPPLWLRYIGSWVVVTNLPGDQLHDGIILVIPSRCMYLPEDERDKLFRKMAAKITNH